MRVRCFPPEHWVGTGYSIFLCKRLFNGLCSTEDHPPFGRKGKVQKEKKDRTCTNIHLCYRSRYFSVKRLYSVVRIPVVRIRYSEEMEGVLSWFLTSVISFYESRLRIWFVSLQFIKRVVVCRSSSISPLNLGSQNKGLLTKQNKTKKGDIEKRMDIRTREGREWDPLVWVLVRKIVSWGLDVRIGVRLFSVRGSVKTTYQSPTEWSCSSRIQILTWVNRNVEVMKKEEN